MSRQQFQRDFDIFTEARGIEDRARRRALIEERCAEEPDVLDEVLRLLAHDETETQGDDLGARISEVVDRAVAARTQDLGVPEQIDDFEIVRRIDTGGMGTVFEAEQQEPRRRVALKLLRADIVSDTALRRFDMEAQVLGNLRHPNIAQIHSLGRADTPSGRLPYIAMEYVDGQRLTHYAQLKQLGMAARIELLIEICNAIEHAHRNGVIHRDLKPANILVDESGRPKVLDFGVARAVERDTPDSLGLTRTGHVIGTLGYMSPEQAMGLKLVDTRADVYSLGVIGFELLSGQVPVDTADMPLPQALRVMYERTAPRLESVDRQLAGDLSLIFAKALEVDRDRRYASAAALADDLRHYLKDEPILARAPTMTYQLGRFVVRNRTVVAAAALTLIGLTVGLAFALISRAEESRQRELADRRAVEAERAAYAVEMQAAGLYFRSFDALNARQRVDDTREKHRGWEWRFLDSSLRRDLAFVPMKVHEKPAPAFSTDAKKAVASTGDHELRVFDFETLAWGPPRTLPQVEVFALAVTSDGRAFAGTRAGQVFLVPEDRPRVVATGLDLVQSLRLDRAGRTLMIGAGTKVHEYDLAMESLAPTSIDIGKGFGAITPTPDGGAFAIGIGYGDAELWNAGGRIRSFERRFWRGVDSRLIQSHVEFSPDGAYVARNAIDQRVVSWSTADGEEVLNLVLRDDLARDIAFHPNGETLVTAHAQSGIRFWDHRSETCLRLSAGESRSHLLRLAFAQEGTRIHAIGREGAFVRHAGPEGFCEVLRGHLGLDDGIGSPYIYDVDFSADGRRLVTTGWDGTLRVWDVATGRQLTSTRLHVPYLARFTPGGRHVVACGSKHHAHLQVWDLHTGDIEVSDRTTYQPAAAMEPTLGLVIGMDGALDVLDPATLELRSRVDVGERIFGVDANADQIAYGTGSGVCAVLDAATRSTTFNVSTGVGVGAIALSRDGRRLAMGASDGTVRLWEIGIDEPRWTVDLIGYVHRGTIYDLAFTPDDRSVVVGSRLGDIHILDADNGYVLLQLSGHTAYVKGIDFSPDGAILASGSGDNTIRLWHTRPVAERLRIAEEVLAREALLRPMVEALFATHETRAEVLAALAESPDLDSDERHAAENVAYLWDQDG